MVVGPPTTGGVFNNLVGTTYPEGHVHVMLVLVVFDNSMPVSGAFTAVGATELFVV